MVISYQVITMIRLIALDLDDTTLLPGGILDGFTRDTLAQATARGIEVVVASGRSFASLPREVLSIPGINYAISSNGAALVDTRSGERIAAFTLRRDCVLRILELFRGELFEGFVDGKAYCDARYYADPVRFGCTPDYVGYVHTTRTPAADMPAFLLSNADRLDSIDVLCGTAEHKTELMPKTEAIGSVYVTSSAPKLIEISDAESGKGRALRRLSELLGVPREDIAAFGNGDNDADMLKFAGTGVAVANASDACKNAADIICESNAENGVAKTILRFFSCKDAPQSTSE